MIDPMHPEKHRVRWEPFDSTKHLIDYVPDNGVEFVASVSGGIVVREDWDTYALRPDDTIVICPVLQGSTGKMILRIAAIVAILYFAPYLAPALGATGLGASLITAGVVIAGTMLVNALLPVPQASLKNNASSSDLAQSPTYGVSGPRNVAIEGIPVPVVYGTHRVAGNILELFTENVEKTQLLYMLLCAGEGPIAGISEITLNNQPLAAFSDVAVDIRTGTNDQSVIPWFNNTIQQQDIGQVVVPNDDTLFRITTGQCDRLRIDVIASQGIFTIDAKTGKLNAASVPLTIGYVKCDIDGNVLPGEVENFDVGQLDVSSYNTDYLYYQIGSLGNGETPDPNATLIGEVKQPALNPGDSVDSDGNIINSGGIKVGQTVQTPNYANAGESGSAVVSGNSRYPLRVSFYSPKITYGYYKVTVKRDTPPGDGTTVIDEIVWDTITQITTQTIAMVNTALLGVKVRLSDQLNGVPNVTYISHGVMVKQWDPVNSVWMLGPSRNPAWATLDMLTNERYGARVPWGQIDVEAFKTWADYCDNRTPTPLTFDAVIDQQMSIWDALKYSLRCGHAQIVRNGMRFTVIIEREDTPVMLFNEGNIIKGTFQSSWLSTADRANVVEITYFDAAQNYTSQTVKIIDPSLTNAGNLGIERAASLSMIGITDRARAIEEGVLMINMNNLITRTVTFEASLDALACTVGSLIYVRHVGVNYGHSGRIVTAAHGSTSVELDQPVTATGGDTMLVHLTGVSIGGTFQAAYKDDTGCFLQWFTGSQFDESRLKWSSLARTLQLSSTSGGTQVEVPVQKIELINDGTPHWRAHIAPEDWHLVPGVSQPYIQIKIGDAVVELPITSAAGNTVSIASADANSAWWGLDPNTSGMTFMLGSPTEMKKTYRITAMQTGSSEYTRTVTALEYNPDVYLSTEFIPPPDSGGNPDGTISQVQNLAINETAVLDAGTLTFQLDVRWEKPAVGTYGGAIVYRQDEGVDEWQTLATVTGDVFDFGFSALLGDTFTIKVVAKSTDGSNAPFSTAPFVVWTVGEGTDLACNATELDATAVLMQNVLTWQVDNPSRLESTSVFFTVGADSTSEPSTNPADSTLAGTTSGFTLTHQINVAAKFRYWIRVTDIAGIQGDYYPEGGVEVGSVFSIGALIDILSDEISSSALDIFLRSRIELIPNLVDFDTFTTAVQEILRLGALTSGNATTIATVQQQQSDDTQATASSIAELGAKFDSNAAAIVLEQQARADADSAEATQRSTLVAQVDNINTNLAGTDVSVYTLTSAIDSSLRAYADNKGNAITSRLDTMETRLFGKNDDGQSIEAGSYIADLQSTTTSLGKSVADISTATDSVQQQVSQILNPSDPNSISASITTINKTLTTGLGTSNPTAQATSLKQLRSTVGDNTNAIEERLTVDQFNAAWTVRIDSGGYVSGVGLGTSQTYPGGPPISDFIVRADRFAIGAPSGGGNNIKDFPFIVATSQDPNQPYGVYIRKGFIMDAAVDTLQIAGNAVSVIASGSQQCTIQVPAGTTINVIGNLTANGSNDRLYAGMELTLLANGGQIGKSFSSLYFGNHDSRSFTMSGACSGTYHNSSGSTQNVTLSFKLVCPSDSSSQWTPSVQNASIIAIGLKK